ncbi:MAG: hypothetical protein ABH813_00800 [Patescibacteria group bacterium]
MQVTKCDLCKKVIKDKSVTAARGYLDRAELCQKCGAPILKFLRKNKFIKEEKRKQYVNR